MDEITIFCRGMDSAFTKYHLGIAKPEPGSKPVTVSVSAKSKYCKVGPKDLTAYFTDNKATTTGRVNRGGRKRGNGA
jgi:hypothetical protein